MDPFLTKFVNFAALTLFLLHCFYFTFSMMEARRPAVDAFYDPDLTRINTALPDTTLGHREYIYYTMMPHIPQNYLHAH